MKLFDTLEQAMKTKNAIIDDAISDVGNIGRRLRQHRAEGHDRPAAAVLDASLEVRRSMVFATTIVVLVVLPIFFLSGESARGSFFQPLALSYLVALGASMLPPPSPPGRARSPRCARAPGARCRAELQAHAGSGPLRSRSVAPRWSSGL